MKLISQRFSPFIFGAFIAASVGNTLPSHLQVLAPIQEAHAIEPNEINPRALEDLKKFVEKSEAGDTAFHQKKYAEAVTAFAEGNKLFQRAIKRDANASSLTLTIAPKSYPALRYYGYGFGQNPSLKEDATGKIFGNGDGLNGVMTEMWQDAAILSGAAKGPIGGGFSESPTIVEYSQDQIDGFIRQIYGPPGRFELPVQDHEWRNLLLWSRRAELILTYALNKYPAWKTSELPWGQQQGNYEITGNQALADIKEKIAEATPEVAKLQGDFNKADPQGFQNSLAMTTNALDALIATAKSDGMLQHSVIREIYITKNFFADHRKRTVEMFTAEGKTVPPGKLKPIDDRIKTLKSEIEKNAPRWTYPRAVAHNAAIENTAKAAVKQYFPGAVPLKSALTTDGWGINKDPDTGLPATRSRGVSVLAKVPGQKWAWLLTGVVIQDYSGGGTFNPGGSFDLRSARVQKAQ